VTLDSLKVLDPEWPIREADIALHHRREQIATAFSFVGWR
jgi:hypothetical protein